MVNSNRPTLGQRLNSVMENERISVAQLASLSGVSRQHIYNLLKDVSDHTDFNKVKAVAGVLDVDASWLYLGKGISDGHRIEDYSIRLETDSVMVISGNRFHSMRSGSLPDLSSFLGITLPGKQYFYFIGNNDCFAANQLVLIDSEGRGSGTYLVNRHIGDEVFYIQALRVDTGLDVQFIYPQCDVDHKDVTVGRVVLSCPWKMEYLQHEVSMPPQ